MIRAARQPVSLETSVGQERDGHFLGDFIEDGTLPQPVEVATKESLKEQLEEALASLSLKERHVIELRFGLTDDRNRTLDEVGRELGVSRERIRQIENKALRKLRHPKRSRKLWGYLD